MSSLNSAFSLWGCLRGDLPRTPQAYHMYIDTELCFFALSSIAEKLARGGSVFHLKYVDYGTVLLHKRVETRSLAAVDLL